MTHTVLYMLMILTSYRRTEKSFIRKKKKCYIEYETDQMTTTTAAAAAATQMSGSCSYSQKGSKSDI